MRKLFIPIILMFAIASAQDTTKLNHIFDIYASVGAGFKTGGTLFSSVTRVDTNTTGREDNYLNYGQGFKIDIGTQFFTSENIAIQADFGASFGIPTFTTEDNITIGGLSTDSTVDYNRNLYSIKVSVVPHFEVLELFNMYTGVGLGFFWNSLHYKTSVVKTSGTTTEKGKIISSPSMGFVGFIGADYPINDLFSAFAELGFEQVSFKWKKRVVDNTNIAGSKVGTHFYEEDDPNNPPPLKVPGSNWQIRVGLRFFVL